jgi:hypothetical protein
MQMFHRRSMRHVQHVSCLTRRGWLTWIRTTRQSIDDICRHHGRTRTTALINTPIGIAISIATPHTRTVSPPPLRNHTITTQTKYLNLNTMHPDA